MAHRRRVSAVTTSSPGIRIARQQLIRIKDGGLNSMGQVRIAHLAQVLWITSRAAKNSRVPGVLDEIPITVEVIERDASA
jgi:hypothetical protein